LHRGRFHLTQWNLLLKDFNLCLYTLLFAVYELFSFRRVNIRALSWGELVLVGAQILVGLLQVEDSLFQVQKVVVLKSSHLLHFGWPYGCDVGLDSRCGDDCTSDCVLVLVKESKFVQTCAYVLVDVLFKRLQRVSIYLLIALAAGARRVHQLVARARHQGVLGLKQARHNPVCSEQDALRQKDFEDLAKRCHLLTVPA